MSLAKYFTMAHFPPYPCVPVTIISGTNLKIGPLLNSSAHLADVHLSACQASPASEKTSEEQGVN
jgi:hypothetical protein